MRISPIALATAVAAMIASAGCSMHQSALSPLAGAPKAAPAARVVSHTGSAPIIYVAETFADQVQVFDQAGKGQAPIATIDEGLLQPEGMFVTPDEDLYVANLAGQDVAVFHKGATAPYETLTDSSEQPVDVAVDTNGTVYVTNYEDTNNDIGSGSISVYAGGSTTPTSTLSIPGNAYVEDCTLDKTHDLYVGYRIDSNGKWAIAKFNNGTGTPHTTAFKIAGAGGMQFDAAQNLAVIDVVNTDIAIYKTGMANPIQTIFVGNGVDGVAFNGGGNHVYAANPNALTIYEYAFPSGTPINSFVADGFPTNIATDPARPL